jgi:hypothetical protein
MALLTSLLPALRASLSRLESSQGAGTGPLDQLGLAILLRAQAALLAGVAAELELRVHDDLGRFGAAVVEHAARAASPDAAANEVADAFLDLCRPLAETDIIGA